MITTRFVKRLLEELRPEDPKGFLTYVNSLIRGAPLIEDCEEEAAAQLSSLVSKPTRLLGGWSSARLLKTVLGCNSVEKALFPTPDIADRLAKLVGKRLPFDPEPELLLPFHVGHGFRARYNPEPVLVEADEIYRFLEEVYGSEPEAVIMVSKYIRWFSFYRLARIVGRTKARTVTFILSADPILPELREKYRIESIKTRTHAKLLLVVKERERLCFLGSMNVLYPSKHGDYLLSIPGLEKFCLKILFKSIIRREKRGQASQRLGTLQE